MAFNMFAAAPQPAQSLFGAQFGAAPAVVQAAEEVPSDPTDRILYKLDKACGTGKALNNAEVVKVLVPVPETAEKPLTKLRDLLEPYRKTKYEFLDKLHEFRFRCILYEQRDGDPKTFDPRLMTSDEWAELYGENAQDVKKYETKTDPKMPLYPVPVEGFDGLSKRLEQQDHALNGAVDPATGQPSSKGLIDTAVTITAQLETLQDRVDRTRERIGALREKSRTQLQRLLRVAQKTELVAFGGGPGLGGQGGYGSNGAYGFAASYSSRGRDENREEAELRGHLTRMLQELRTQHDLGARVGQLQMRVESHLQSVASSSGAGAFGAWGMQSAYAQPGAAPPAPPQQQAVLTAGTQDMLQRLEREILRLKGVVREAQVVTQVADRALSQALQGQP